MGYVMPVKIVAELSGNHLGKLQNALDLIKVAKACGADAVKLQTFTPDTITVHGDHPDLIIKDGPWKGRHLYNLYQEAATPWEWHVELFEYARELGLECFSTPFDETAVDFLETLNCPIYKISSFDVVNVPLLERVREAGKPVIMSTGMASMEEKRDALTLLLRKVRDVTLLHCVSEYPAEPSEMNLRDMDMRIVSFQGDWVRYGLSDHSIPPTAAICAVALGATVIEKHICLDRSLGGPDSAFSLEPQEFKETVRLIREAEAACSQPPGVPIDTHKSLRPSLWFVKDMEAGEVITKEHVAVRRPGSGSHSRHYWEVIGKKAQAPVKAPAPVSLEMVGLGSVK